MRRPSRSPRAPAAVLLLAVTACVAPRRPPPEDLAPDARVAGEMRGGERGEVPPAPAGAPPAGTEPSAPDATPRARPPRPLSGSLSLRYRARATKDDSDHDLRALLGLDYADPRTPRVAGHFLARADLDLDGLDDGPVFQGLSDTYDSSLVAKLYLAYVDVATGERLGDDAGRLRLGRQSDPNLPEFVRLDGASYRSPTLGQRDVQLGVYGGIPVHLYEDSPEGNRAFGTWVEGRPWKNGRARFDWMHLEDEIVLGTERNDLLSLGLWQRLSERWRAEGEITRVEGDPRDVTLRAFYDDPSSETLVRVRYHELQDTQAYLVNELDPFTEQLLEYAPFRQATLDASRALSEHVVLEGGFDVRRVRDAGDVGEFNRDWERYRAALRLRDLGTEGLDLTVNGDRWNDHGRDIDSLGADLSYASDDWRAALGTDWALFKYDFLELSEREDVRTYYVNYSRDLSAGWRLDASYEIEDDDLYVYHTVRLGARWRF